MECSVRSIHPLATLRRPLSVAGESAQPPSMIGAAAGADHPDDRSGAADLLESVPVGIGLQGQRLVSCSLVGRGRFASAASASEKRLEIRWLVRTGSCIPDG